jgi:D-3-phosphoglycerate dehydrogenase
MPHALIIGRVHDSGLDLLRARPDASFEEVDEKSPPAIMAAMPRADGIVLRTARITAELIQAAPNLRVVSRHGVGYDNVDGAALAARGIPLAISATANMVSVAEHALFMILALMKRGQEEDRAVRAGDWSGRVRPRTIELYGKRLLIVGFGRIGRLVARRALAFDAEVMVSDPYVDRGLIEAAGCAVVTDLGAALGQADVVSLHVPLTDETRNLIDAGALGAMKPEAILVNTARGGIVDEPALARALEGGQLKAAGIDVFGAEPPAADNPLLKAPNLLLSPHIAGVTQEGSLRMARESVENVLAAWDGRLDPSLIVNGVRAGEGPCRG